MFYCPESPWNLSFSAAQAPPVLLWTPQDQYCPHCLFLQPCEDQWLLPVIRGSPCAFIFTVFVLELPPSCLSSVAVELGFVWAYVFRCVHSIQTLGYKLYQQSFKSCLLFAEGHVFDSYYKRARVCMGGHICHGTWVKVRGQASGIYSCGDLNKNGLSISIGSCLILGWYSVGECWYSESECQGEGREEVFVFPRPSAQHLPSPVFCLCRQAYSDRQHSVVREEKGRKQPNLYQ